MERTILLSSLFVLCVDASIGTLCGQMTPNVLGPYRCQGPRLRRHVDGPVLLQYWSQRDLSNFVLVLGQG